MSEKNPRRHRDLDGAIAAALAAGAVIREFYEGQTAATYAKGDGSPVTDADLAADEAIRAVLNERFPDDAILSEEGADDRARLSSRRCWIVDPLDGTSHLVAGSDDFDTFVALAVDGSPVVAVSVHPVTGLRLGAVAGGGAWMQAANGPRQPLVLTPVKPWRVATKSWLGAPDNLTALGAVVRAVDGRLLQPTFSLCPRCFLPPSPSIDAMVGLPGGTPIEACEWDVAPADLIVREAGGAATDLTGAPLRYNQPEPRFGSGLIIAADPVLHEGLVAALSR